MNDARELLSGCVGALDLDVEHEAAAVEAIIRADTHLREMLKSAEAAQLALADACLRFSSFGPAFC